MSTPSLSDERAIAVTAGFALQSIGEGSPAALLLALCSFLAPEDIPRRMLVGGAADVPPVLRDCLREPLALVSAIGTLSRYSLMEVNDDALAVHRSLQRAVRDRLDPGERVQWANAAANVVLGQLSGAPQTSSAVWPWYARLLPHAAKAGDHVGVLGGDLAVALELRLRCGTYLIAQGQLARARTSLDDALLLVTGFEPEGRLHGTVLNLLAVVDRELGFFKSAKQRATRALGIHSRLVELRRPADPPRDPRAKTAPDAKLSADNSLPPDRDRADDLRNLGSIALKQGDFVEATGYISEARAIIKKLDGAESAAMVPVLEELFSLKVESDTWESALEILRLEVKIQIATNGEGSNEAVLSSKLLEMLTEREDPVPHAIAIVAKLEQAYGPLHPSTADGVRLLGYMLRRLGAFDEAKLRLEQAIAIDRANYGPRHFRIGLGLVDLMLLEAAQGGIETAEGYLREALDVVLAAAPEDRVTTLRQLRLDAALADAAALEQARQIVPRTMSIAADVAGADEAVIDVVRRTVIRAERISGDSLLVAADRGRAAVEYRNGLELARHTLETPFDDAEFLVRLGVLAALDGDVSQMMGRLREALVCLSTGEIRSPLWTLTQECGSLTAVTGTDQRLEDALDALFAQAKEDGAVTEFDGELAGLLPDGWFVKESMTLLSPDGQANIIASGEPLGTGIDTDQYARIQGDLLVKEFPGYEEKSYERIPVFGDRLGWLRSFEWTPEGGERVAQLQLYYAEGERGYTATATTTAANFAGIEMLLGVALRGLRLKHSARYAAPSGAVEAGG